MIGRPVPPPLGSLRRATAARAGAAHRASAYGIAERGGPLVALEVPRRAALPDDVVIDIDFCGLCHSDVHAGRGEWGARQLPLVPGHEIVGRVAAVGREVSGFAVGQRVGVGCLVDSCRECASCREGLEQFCERGGVGTYGALDRRTGEYTQGGYSSSIVVNQGYVLHVPESLDPAAAAPLLCAGITTYSPLRHFGAGPGSGVGVVGLGGLGHMAVKLAKALGASVTVFTTSASKVEAARALGADTVVVSGDAEAMKPVRHTLDLVIDTVAAPHSLDPYFATLRRDGTLVQLGLPGEPMPPVNPRPLLARRLRYTGSPIGGIAETQEMLDFCAEHAVAAEVEVVDAAGLNAAWDRMVAGDVRYRFVLDASTLPAPQTPAPPTSAPPTSAPQTPAPPTSAPRTSAPQTPPAE
ncbi:alcohol dehydrogenase [Zafaria cholistanensis]|uniref:alcohol dehydrogenase (NADP(+)) n=1 Tax=Zafaria cholistanensis TaxID=1682741 RepID=A0A5A7NT55_9MICC|nr:NAD(P)-dependent alcohol dehydrogenase [Zafaria cholistanensis]GER24060.1 alcohol dehydrogenase [Zafaria cholistanensis]